MQPLTLGAYTLQVRILDDMQRFAEVDALFEAARPHFPVLSLTLAAQSARRRGDLPAAIGRWQRLRREFPTDLRAFESGAQCLIEAGRLDEADALLREAMLCFPDKDRLASRWAGLAAHRRDWPEALLRWQSVAERFPGCMPALLGTANSLCELQCFDEAEALLKAKRTDFGGRPEPSVQYAKLAQRRRDWPEAERRWELVRGISPRNIPAYLGLAVALREQQRFDEAQVLLEEATEKDPGARSLFIEHAELAHHRREWVEAVRRWEVVRTRFPDQPVGFHRGAAALAALGRKDEAEQLKSDANLRFAATSG
jgi:tetratricopeptide (TPR) repeat protein